jgi:hypothetical protein
MVMAWHLRYCDHGLWVLLSAYMRICLSCSQLQDTTHLTVTAALPCDLASCNSMLRTCGIQSLVGISAQQLHNMLPASCYCTDTLVACMYCSCRFPVCLRCCLCWSSSRPAQSQLRSSAAAHCRDGGGAAVDVASSNGVVQCSRRFV